MLPTKEIQDNKVREIYDNLNTDNLEEPILVIVAKKYAKWYAEQVIKHCAEVAIVEDYTQDDGRMLVDKQSILNVISEL